MLLLMLLMLLLLLLLMLMLMLLLLLMMMMMMMRMRMRMRMITIAISLSPFLTFKLLRITYLIGIRFTVNFHDFHVFFWLYELLPSSPSPSFHRRPVLHRCYPVWTARSSCDCRPKRHCGKLSGTSVSL